MEVDTTAMAMAYATCHAVWEALGKKPKRPPYLGDKTGSYIFPT